MTPAKIWVPFVPSFYGFETGTWNRNRLLNVLCHPHQCATGQYIENLCFIPITVGAFPFLILKRELSLLLPCLINPHVAGSKVKDAQEPAGKSRLSCCL